MAAAGKPPQQKTVDSAEGDLTCAGALAEPRHAVEQPADLRGGEIRIDDEPGSLRDDIRETIGAPALADFLGPAILPDDRFVDRAPGRPVPQNRRLPLVGDADRRNRAVCRRQRLTARRNDPLPDLLGIVLHPTRLWVSSTCATLRDRPRLSNRIARVLVVP